MGEGFVLFCLFKLLITKMLGVGLCLGSSGLASLLLKGNPLNGS